MEGVVDGGWLCLYSFVWALLCVAEFLHRNEEVAPPLCCGTLEM